MYVHTPHTHPLIHAAPYSHTRIYPPTHAGGFVTIKRSEANLEAAEKHDGMKCRPM